MADTDQKQMDNVLRRMLATPPTPHMPLGERRERAETRPRSQKKQKKPS